MTLAQACETVFRSGWFNQSIAVRKINAFIEENGNDVDKRDAYYADMSDDYVRTVRERAGIAQRIAVRMEASGQCVN